MMIGSIQARRMLLPLGGFALLVLMMTTPDPLYPTPQQGAADNTSQDKDQTSPNADKQGMSSSDRAITQKIRNAIYQDNSLLTYAHDTKIITRNGIVTLRGPARSDDEENNPQAEAVAVAEETNVINNLEIDPAKYVINSRFPACAGSGKGMLNF